MHILLITYLLTTNSNRYMCRMMCYKDLSNILPTFTIHVWILHVYILVAVFDHLHFMLPHNINMEFILLHNCICGPQNTFFVFVYEIIRKWSYNTHFDDQFGSHLGGHFEFSCIIWHIIMECIIENEFVDLENLYPDTNFVFLPRIITESLHHTHFGGHYGGHLNFLCFIWHVHVIHHYKWIPCL